MTVGLRVNVCSRSPSLIRERGEEIRLDFAGHHENEQRNLRDSISILQLFLDQLNNSLVANPAMAPKRKLYGAAAAAAAAKKNRTQASAAIPVHGGHHTTESLGSCRGCIALFLEEERYAEAEHLIWKWLTNAEDLKATSTNSANSEFPVSYSPKKRWSVIQKLLASHRTPDKSFFWEDSRMYLRRWARSTLVPVVPLDSFPQAPVKLVINGNDFTIDIPQCVLQDLQETHGGVSAISLFKRTRLWQYAELLQSEGRLQSLIPGEMWRESLVSLWFFLDEQLEAGPIENISANVSSLDPQTCLFLAIRRVPRSTSDFMAVGSPVVGLPAAESKWLERHFHSSLEEMRYSIDETDEHDIHITVPFIPYEHFQRTRAWSYGFTYVEYVEVLQQSLCSKSYGSIHLRGKISKDIKPRKRMPLWYLPRKTQSDKIDDLPHLTSESQSFFNGVPSGPVLVDTQSISGGCSLVSSSWSDWTRFTLYEATPRQTPNLILSDQTKVYCHGYIMGRWSANDLSRQWKGVKLFVVDVEFGVDGEDTRCNFLLNLDGFTDMNVYSLCSLEKLAICGSLNPRMFRYAPPDRSRGRRGTTWNRSKKVKKNAIETIVQESFWEEMNRREMWDRGFERRTKSISENRHGSKDDEKALEKLAVEKKEEEERRWNWDAKQMLNATKVQSTELGPSACASH